MPKAYNEKFLENTFFCTSFEDFNFIFWSEEAEQINLVFFEMNENPSSVPKTLSTVKTYLLFLKIRTNVWSIATK